jgi:hypothetical protein
MSKQAKIAAIFKQASKVSNDMQNAKTADQKKAARKQLADFLSGK